MVEDDHQHCGAAEEDGQAVEGGVGDHCRWWVVEMEDGVFGVGSALMGVLEGMLLLCGRVWSCFLRMIDLGFASESKKYCGCSSKITIFLETCPSFQPPLDWISDLGSGAAPHFSPRSVTSLIRTFSAHRLDFPQTPPRPA